MASTELNEILRRIEMLSSEEQLQVISYLANKARGKAASRRRWNEIRGIAAHPLAGEDAQQWVSRSRRDADMHRGRRQNNES